MDGNMMELGPYRVQKDGTLRYNDGSWDEFANLLFVDNPVGTGFSYVDSNAYVHELKDMASQMVLFLEKFFALFPDYASDDVSGYTEWTLRADADSSLAIRCRRVIRRPAYSLHHAGNTRPQF